MNKTQKEIIKFLQGDLPLQSNPYSELAEKLKISEDEIICQIKILKKDGYIRRFGAILSHHKIGLKSNCMCVWQVSGSKINKIALVAQSRPEISHCYTRKIFSDWPYNFYTMIHGKTKADCQKVVDELAKSVKANDYKMLFTKKQFKKTSPNYKI